MKIRTAVWFLLIPATVWGCSDSAPGPVDPDLVAAENPAAAKPDGGGGGSAPDQAIDFTFPSDGFGITSDGIGVYADGSCGVSGTLFGASGDAVMGTSDRSSGGRKCPDFPRKLMVHYPDGTSEARAVHMNLQGVAGMAVGTSRTDVPLNIGLEEGVRCEALRFRSQLRDLSETGADYVRVDRTEAGWAVSNAQSTDEDSVPAEAACYVNGVQTGTVQVTLSFEVRLSS